MFNASSYSGDEIGGIIAVTVTVFATGVSSLPYSIMTTPSELIAIVSA